MKKENKLFIISLGAMVFASSILYSCVYEPRVMKQQNETIGKEIQTTESYDDSVVLEGKVVYIVMDEYDHSYLRQVINGSIVYIPYTFIDQEEANVDPTLPIYANKNEKNG
jgi:hypothetical protein